MVEHTAPLGGSGDGSGVALASRSRARSRRAPTSSSAGEDLPRGDAVLAGGPAAAAAGSGGCWPRSASTDVERLPPPARRRAVDRQRALRPPRPRRARARCATPTSTALGAQVDARPAATSPAPASSPTTPTALRAADRAPARRARRRDPLGRLVGRDEGPLRRRRWAICRRPASCFTASTSARASRRCSRARATSRSSACPVFPTSSLVVFDAFIRPMLWRLGGEVGAPARGPRAARARLAARIASVVGREDYLRVRLDERDGAPGPIRCPAARRRSPTSCAPTACVRPRRVEHLDAGAPVEALVYL